METIEHLRAAGLESMHFILGYAGLLLNLLMKAGEEYPTADFTFKAFFKRNLFSILFSLIAIPVLLIMATDTSIHEFLPINYVTSVLAGWQTQSLFKSTFAMVANRRTNGNGLPPINPNGTSTPQ